MCAAGARVLSAETQLKLHSCFYKNVVLRLATGADCCAEVAGLLRKGWATALSEANEDSRSIPSHLQRLASQPSDDSALFYLQPVG